MVVLVGETAGKIFEFLDDNGEATVAKLRKEVGADAFTLNAAIGWLAREDKLVITKSGNSVKIALK